MQNAKPGNKCSDINNAMLKILSKHSPTSNSVGRMGHGIGLQLTEPPSIMANDNTVLKENMVVSMEPMILIPEGKAGAGGYREHDILVIGKNKTENITKFPFGPEHNIIKE